MSVISYLTVVFELQLFITCTLLPNHCFNIASFWLYHDNLKQLGHSLGTDPAWISPIILTNVKMFKLSTSVRLTDTVGQTFLELLFKPQLSEEDIDRLLIYSLEIVVW